MIPHVTQYDKSDVTELEQFRVDSNAALAKAKSTVKLTMLAFVIKACVTALKKYPAFNASLSADGASLILKQYYNIGFAADTPQGLVVPVLKDADKKSVSQIAVEMGELSAAAREGKLKPTDMQGASFTISSLGGIGGTYFTPIINAPEVAILGLSKTAMEPVWDGAGLPAPPDAAAVAVLRPPRHRRRHGRALHRLPGRDPRRPAQDPAVIGAH